VRERRDWRLFLFLYTQKTPQISPRSRNTQIHLTISVK